MSAHANWSVALTAGQTLAYNEKGFDHSTLTAGQGYVSIPAAADVDIWGALSGQQYYPAAMYVRLPTLADWNPDSELQPFLCSTSAAAGYTTDADLLTIAQAGGGTEQITARRQTIGFQYRGDFALIREISVTLRRPVLAISPAVMQHL